MRSRRRSAAGGCIEPLLYLALVATGFFFLLPTMVNQTVQRHLASSSPLPGGTPSLEEAAAVGAQPSATSPAIARPSSPASEAVVEPTAVSPSLTAPPASATPEPTAQPLPSLTPPPAPESGSGPLESELLELVNLLRSAEGCPPLAVDPLLQQAAQGHSLDLAERRTVDHSGSDGASLHQRLDRVGYPYQLYGENIAAGYTTPQEVIDMWTTGDEYPDGPHRKNLLNCSYIEAGVGLAAADDDYRYWVLDLASRR